jgi:hypothetical protein
MKITNPRFWLKTGISIYNLFIYDLQLVRNLSKSRILEKNILKVLFYGNLQWIPFRITKTVQGFEPIGIGWKLPFTPSTTEIISK